MGLATIDPHSQKEHTEFHKIPTIVFQRCDFMHFGGQSVTENELFMIINLDRASSAVSLLFKYCFPLETSQSLYKLIVVRVQLL